MLVRILIRMLDELLRLFKKYVFKNDKIAMTPLKFLCLQFAYDKWARSKDSTL